MLMLTDCSSCRTPLQLPSGASSVRCTVCRAVTPVAAPPLAPAPSLDNGLLSFGQTPSVSGRKRAVICGVSYKGTKFELNGSINDAKCMKYLLVNTFKFPESSILMLTDKRKRRLQTKGMILDDEINATIVKPMPHGVKLHAIIDACHSGTMLDLSFLCRMDRNGRYIWEDHIPPTGHFKGTNGGEVICFSGCDDHQISADTTSLSKVTSTGAMTYAFTEAIEMGHATTYGDILTSMRTTIRKIASDGALSSLLGMLFTRGRHGGGWKQEPQLTASEPFDVFTKRFSL